MKKLDYFQEAFLGWYLGLKIKPRVDIFQAFFGKSLFTPVPPFKWGYRNRMVKVFNFLTNDIEVIDNLDSLTNEFPGVHDLEVTMLPGNLVKSKSTGTHLSEISCHPANSFKSSANDQSMWHRLHICTFRNAVFTNSLILLIYWLSLPIMVFQQK